MRELRQRIPYVCTINDDDQRRGDSIERAVEDIHSCITEGLPVIGDHIGRCLTILNGIMDFPRDSGLLLWIAPPRKEL